MKNLTKAEALRHLNKKLKNNKSIIVPNFIFFNKELFLRNEQKLIKKLLNIFSKEIIIRSSAKNEDTRFSSLAGKYNSFIIKKPNKKNIEKYIKLIISDFKNKKDQIIVQDFMNNMDISGVIFTRDPKTGSEYYLINYDKSGKTNLITSGSENLSMKTLYVFKKKISYSNKFYKILNKIKKIETVFKNDCLDIEFGIKNNKLFIFQCRPLIKKNSKITIDEHLKNIKKKIEKINNNPILFGKKTILSNMSDWNPAEMIGSIPKPLAISLYTELITNEVWAKQRDQYGYRDVRPNVLMYNIYGKPYIDVRTDFNSFLPKGLPEKLYEKIINNRINFLSRNKHLHDKIEFEVIETCFNFNTKKNLSNYLSKKETQNYLSRLKQITENIINSKLILKDKNKINKLFNSIESLKKKKLSHIQNIFFLIKMCKIYGTLPFAGLARCAFIGTILLNSLKENEILSEKDIKNLYESINTISKNIKSDSVNIWKNKNDKKNFIDKYGHLRPLTYSINSKNYKENLNKYFPKKSGQKKINYKKFNLSRLQTLNIKKILKREKLSFSPKELFDFIKESIRLREYGKYVFSKCIDEIFLNLIKLGKEVKIKRNELDFIDINLLLKSYNNLRTDKLAHELRKQILKFKHDLRITEKISFPDIICSENDIYSFKTFTSKGNFFSENNITSSCILYKDNISDNQLKNKIIMIENADPGFDFIFNKRIAGLITKFGGSNSHMSIRCMEENLPACIGVGETQFNVLQNSKIIELNCRQKIIKIIS